MPFLASLLLNLDTSLGDLPGFSEEVNNAERSLFVSKCGDTLLEVSSVESLNLDDCFYSCLLYTSPRPRDS